MPNQQEIEVLNLQIEEKMKQLEINAQKQDLTACLLLEDELSRLLQERNFKETANLIINNTNYLIKNEKMLTKIWDFLVKEAKKREKEAEEQANKGFFKRFLKARK